MIKEKSSNLKEFLKNHRYTYRGFGSKVGVCGQAVLHWCSGRSVPSESNIDAVIKLISYDERCSMKEAKSILNKSVDNS